MNYARTLLTSKYAQAFVNVYGETLTPDDCLRIASCAEALKNQWFFAFLSYSFIEYSIKIDLLTSWRKQCNLPESFDRLIVVLLQAKRTEVLPEVLKQIVLLYQQQHGIISFSIMTSHPLAAENLVLLKEILAAKTGRDIIYDYKVDASLIAGIRMQSNTLLWEHSVKQQLRLLTQTHIQ